MRDRGLSLTLLLGPTKPVPAPAKLIEALVGAEVQRSYAGAAAFQVTFALAKDNLIDYDLLYDDLLMPTRRLCLQVRFGVRPEVLIDGLITHHQVRPDNRPGGTVLVVSGDDVSTRMLQKHEVKAFPGLTDSDIVTQVLEPYHEFGLNTDVTRTTRKPGRAERHRVQTCTDLQLIRDLAAANGFVFSIDPTKPGSSTAYWGPEDRRTRQEPPLAMNRGSATNVDQPIIFSFNALGPVKPVAAVVQSSDASQDVQAPPLPEPRLVKRPAEALRTTELTGIWGLTNEEVRLRALEAVIESADAVTGTGQVDIARYGTLLRVGRRVRVAGVGSSYNGDYLVRRVTTELRPDVATQRFVLGREGLGALRGGGVG